MRLRLCFGVPVERSRDTELLSALDGVEEGLLERGSLVGTQFVTDILLDQFVFGDVNLFAVIVFGLISGTAAGLAAALSPLTLILPGSVLARKVGWPWSCAVLVPFMIPAFLYAMVNSTWVTLRQGGVRWRDTFYSLETLRTGTVR